MAAVGDAAPPLPGGRSLDGPALVAFLRHTGCPFAEATLRALRPLADAHPDLQVIAIGHGRPDAAARWCDALGGAGRVALVVDEARASHAAWGVPSTGAGHFLGARSLAGVLRLLARGIRNRRASGTRFQSAATFTVAGGRIAWRHLPRNAADLPDLAAALASLGK